VQWFISDFGDTQLNSLYSEYGSKVLPLSPDVDGFLYEAKFYDFDFVLPPCNDLQSPLQIKSFDVLKFNVFPDQNNLEGVESAVIGIIDNEGNIIDSNIGEAVYPDCYFNNSVTVSFDATDILASIISNSDDTIFSFLFCSVSDSTITIPFSEYSTAANFTEYAQALVDYINTVDGYTASFGSVGTVFTFTILLADELIINKVDYSAGTFFFEGTQSGKCNPTQ
jgi:hypothetical protein